MFRVNIHHGDPARERRPGIYIPDIPKMNRNFIKRIQSQDKNDIMGIDEYIKQEAKEEGRIEEREKPVRLFLKNTEFSVSKIANLIGVSVSFVKKVKEQMQSK